MEFVTLKDVEAPQDHVFGAMVDFAAFERQALRHDIEVVRTSGAARVGLGTSWRVKFEYRSRPWAVDARITNFEPTSGYVITGTTSGLDVVALVDLLSLARGITRLSITIRLEPRSMTTRLLVQSLRFVRGSIQARLDQRIARLASDIEDRWRAIG